MGSHLWVDDSSVINCCSKCMPKPGESGQLHRIEFEGTRLMCQNPDCRHDWTDWTGRWKAVVVPHK